MCSPVMSRVQEEEKCLMVVESFIRVMDNHVEFPIYNISDNAVMDWFGRSICGRSSIIRSAKTHFPKSQHNIDSVVRIPYKSHRLLRQFEKKGIKEPTIQQGNCYEAENQQHTPDNPIRPNFEELIKAPKGKENHWTVDSTDLEFVEIKGSLQYEQTFFDGTTSQLVEKEIKKIVLGYSDEIHFIEYANSKPCRVNLFHRFRSFS